MNLRFEDEALGLYQQVTLATLHLLAPIVTSMFSAYPGALHGLGIHHARAGL